MNNQQKVLLFLGLITAVVLLARRAHAEETVPFMQSSVATAAAARGAQRQDARADAAHEIRSAVRRLDQAALQWEFAGRAEELALLESAHDRLAPALRKLCCAQRVRAAELESDIDRLIARATAQRGPLLLATGASYGPPAPSRDQLVLLAREGQDLERGAPLTHHPASAASIDASRRHGRDTSRANDPAPLDAAGAGLLSWPPDRPQTANQFHFQF